MSPATHAYGALVVSLDTNDSVFTLCVCCALASLSSSILNIHNVTGEALLVFILMAETGKKALRVVFAFLLG